MPNRKIVRHVVRETRIAPEEAQRLNEIRRQAMQAFPPVESPPGIPAPIRAARQEKRMSWHAVAEAAGIPDASTVRDIELGRDTRVSDVEAVARALGLRLELVVVEA